MEYDGDGGGRISSAPAPAIPAEAGTGLTRAASGPGASMQASSGGGAPQDLDKGVKVEMFQAPGAGGQANVLIKVTPPSAGTKRLPIDMVCVLDVSGSMGMEATIAGGESNGLTMLDVAKHGAKTVAHALQAEDQFSLVTFNNQARVVFPLTKMNEAGHKKADDELDQIMQGGGTNIWEGLRQALETLKARAKGGNRLAHIVLLTDGESIERERIVPNLQEYKRAHESLHGTINTFGFGYNLDSQLLVDLAKEGHGSYAFIPDAGMVGTAFVHSVSNCLVTMAVETKLKLDLDDARIQGSTIPGGYTVEPSGTLINIGTLQYGQTKDIVVPVSKVSDICVNLAYETRFEKFETQPFEGVSENVMKVKAQICRCAYVDAVVKMQAEFKQKGVSEPTLNFAREQCQNASREINSFLATFTDTSSPDVVAMLELKKDVEGQTMEAISRTDFYQRWGRHYLSSIASAHQLQQCNNFKDPGVQVYGMGEVFQAVRDEADDVFNTLPAPKPRARPSYSSGGGGYSAPAPSAPVNMAAYNDRYAG